MKKLIILAVLLCGVNLSSNAQTIHDLPNKEFMIYQLYDIQKGVPGTFIYGKQLTEGHWHEARIDNLLPGESTPEWTITINNYPPSISGGMNVQFYTIYYAKQVFTYPIHVSVSTNMRSSTIIYNVFNSGLEQP